MAGRDAWVDRVTRLKLRQAFGRLIRRASDRGVFVMLDSRLPTRADIRLLPGVQVECVGLAEPSASLCVSWGSVIHYRVLAEAFRQF